MNTNKPGRKYIEHMSFEEILIRYVRTRKEEVVPEPDGDRISHQPTRILFKSDAGLVVELFQMDQTLWMTREQIAKLYQRHVSGIGRHVSMVLSELEPASNRHVSTYKPESASRTLRIYDLKIVVLVGQRIAPRQAALLRKWANRILVNFDE